MPVFTIVAAGVPHRYSAELAPTIGEIVTADESRATVRVLRSADGGRVFIGEVVADRA